MLVCSLPSVDIDAFEDENSISSSAASLLALLSLGDKSLTLVGLKVAIELVSGLNWKVTDFGANFCCSGVSG